MQTYWGLFEKSGTFFPLKDSEKWIQEVYAVLEHFQKERHISKGWVYSSYYTALICRERVRIAKKEFPTQCLLRITWAKSSSFPVRSWSDDFNGHPTWDLRLWNFEKHCKASKSCTLNLQRRFIFYHEKSFNQRLQKCFLFEWEKYCLGTL